MINHASITINVSMLWEEPRTLTIWTICFSERQRAITTDFGKALKILKYFSVPATQHMMEESYLRDLQRAIALAPDYAFRCDPASANASCHHPDALVTQCRFGDPDRLEHECKLFSPSYSSRGLVRISNK